MNKIEIKDFISDLQNSLSGQIKYDEYSRILYSTDASIYQVKPIAVLTPKSDEDIQNALEIAINYQIPVLPRGAGSSLAGQAVNRALIIDTSRYLNKVIETNQDEKWVRVQPGVVLDELNLYLKKFSLQYGPDPASSDRATLGGIVGNNSTGSHSILYGMTADHVIEVKTLLSNASFTKFGPIQPDHWINGNPSDSLSNQIHWKILELAQKNREIILAGTPKHWRRCGGYNLDRFVPGPNFRVSQPPDFNLAKLICGSEGTLGIITEIKLNLVSRPTKTALAIVHFNSLFEALSSVPIILEADPSAIELLDNLGLTLCRKVPEYARLLTTFIEGNPNCILITEFYGESDTELKHKIQNLQKKLIQNQIKCHIISGYTDQFQGNVWKVRKVGLGLMMSIKGDHKPIPFIEDAAVPPEHLAEYVTKVEKFCNDIGTNVAYYAHASAGCIHIRPLINTKDATDVAKLPQITNFSVELLGNYGGALSSEHGDGRARSWINPKFFGEELYNLFCQVKNIFDPTNILNPGNIVEAPAMTENLRYGPTYQTLPIVPHIDFSEEMGFDRAVEMCNGAGICRKKTTGTMCPSFMVTQEETDSTRGRANALRAALMGLLPADEFTSPEMFKVMDLCVECKACKAECPSSVDMAKIKIEFLAHYYEKNPVSFRTKLFANIHQISRLTSGISAPTVNALGRSKWFRNILEKWIGIHFDRPLPAFARQPFEQWFNLRKKTNGETQDKKEIVLFVDTFNNFNTPKPLIAAAELMELLGYKVILSQHGCCGRPLISKGLINNARKAAETTVNRLAKFANRGVPIIGLEPSCILSLRDEYLYLLPKNQQTCTVAKQALTFEEWFASILEENQINLSFSSDINHLLLHGHCHQKSLVGMEPSKKCFGELKNSTIEEIDSGCCGMAGAFGYEKEHYNVSIAMAKRRLLPAIRANEESIIVASGFSCRQQIKHNTGRDAYHPVEIIRKSVKIEN